MMSSKLLSGFVVLAAVLLIPNLGRAQTCASNADCAKGLSCQASAGASTPAMICYDGDAGGACESVPPPATTLSMSCQPAPCVSSADCGADMVCNSQTVTTCTGGTAIAVKCDPSSACDAGAAPEPPVCTESTTSQCRYKWDMPCNVDLDCGDGFVCQPTETGMCSGSTPGTASSGSGSASSGTGGGTGTSTSADTDAGPASTCTTTSFPGHCASKITTCQVDADCPSTWTCKSANVATTGGSKPSVIDAGVAPAPVPVAIDGGVPVPVVTPTETAAKTCQAPYGTESEDGNARKTGTLAATGDAGVKADAGTQATATTTPPTPNAPVVNGPGGSQTSASTNGGGGCSLAAGALPSDPGLVLGLLATVGLLAIRRRRR
jgi:hypothetical protein